MLDIFDINDHLAQLLADGAPNLEELCCITLDLTKPMPKIGRLRKLSILFTTPKQLEFATKNNGQELITIRSERNFRIPVVHGLKYFDEFARREDFVFLANCPKLQRLILRHLKITDDSVKGIGQYTPASQAFDANASASNNSRNYLTELDLSGNHLTKLPIPLHEILKYPDELCKLRIANNRWRQINPPDPLKASSKSSSTKSAGSAGSADSLLQSAKHLRHLDTSGVFNTTDSFSLADHYPALESWRPRSIFAENFKPASPSHLSHLTRLDLTRMEEKKV